MNLICRRQACALVRRYQEDEGGSRHLALHSPDRDDLIKSLLGAVLINVGRRPNPRVLGLTCDGL